MRLAQKLYGRRKRTACCEHGIHDEAGTALDIWRKLTVVLMRRMGCGITIHPHVPDARGGNEREQAVHHTQAGAQDGNDGDLLSRDSLADGLLERSRYLDILKGKVTHGLIALEDRKLADQFAKLLGGSVPVAQDVQLVLDQRMIDDRKATCVEPHALPLLDWTRPAPSRGTVA